MPLGDKKFKQKALKTIKFNTFQYFLGGVKDVMCCVRVFHIEFLCQNSSKLVNGNIECETPSKNTVTNFKVTSGES